MNPRRTTALALTAAVLMLSFTGCTTPEPTPSSTKTATATPTPTTDPTVAPTREPVTAPADAATAIHDANEAYLGFQQARFDFLATPELGPDYLENYVMPGSRMATLMQNTYDNKIGSKTSVEGEPFAWTLNEALTYTAPLQNQETGETDPFGAVNLIGCSDNTGTTFLVDGVESAEVPKGSFPKHVVMIYNSDSEGWFINDTIDLDGQEGAPLC